MSFIKNLLAKWNIIMLINSVKNIEEIPINDAL